MVLLKEDKLVNAINQFAGFIFYTQITFYSFILACSDFNANVYSFYHL
jgi:hypothetical protein